MFYFRKPIRDIFYSIIADYNSVSSCLKNKHLDILLHYLKQKTEIYNKFAITDNINNLQNFLKYIFEINIK